MKNYFVVFLSALILSACSDAGRVATDVSVSAPVAEPVPTSEPVIVSDSATMIQDQEPENVEQHRVWARCGKDKKLGVYFGAHFIRVKINNADQDIILLPEPSAANQDSVYLTDDKQYKLVNKRNSDRFEWTEPKKIAEICEMEKTQASDVSAPVQ